MMVVMIVHQEFFDVYDDGLDTDQDGICVILEDITLLINSSVAPADGGDGCNYLYETQELDFGILQNQITEIAVSWTSSSGYVCGGYCGSTQFNLEIIDSENNVIDSYLSGNCYTPGTEGTHTFYTDFSSNSTTLPTLFVHTIDVQNPSAKIDYIVYNNSQIDYGENGDNCPDISNPDQDDFDQDGLGDVCDQEPECATNNTDVCGVCDGGNADQDCAGECFGDLVLDDCGVCNGGNADIGCNGVCFSELVNDECGVCGGGGIAGLGYELNQDKIAGGRFHNIAIKQNGDLIAWGNGDQGQTVIPNELEEAINSGDNVIQVDAGCYHNMALTESGDVYAWGYNNHGQSDVPDDLSNVVQISAGCEVSMALTESGEIHAWGLNDYYQIDIPGGLDDIVEIAMGDKHAFGSI